MAKVLFINPVIRQQDKPRHVPYGMALLAAMASKEKHKVQVFDANAWRPSDEDLVQVLRADQWDVIGIGGLVTTYSYIKKVVRYARLVSPKSLIVAGGGFLTPIPHEVLGFLPEIDIGVVGEGFRTFPEVLQRVDEKCQDWSDLLGIIWRDKDGVPHLNREAALLEDIDSLPFPAWDMFPLDIYFRNSSILMSEEAMQARRRLDVMASYGCPYRCRFCFHLGLSGELSTVDEGSERQVSFTHRRTVRWHSPIHVVEQIKHARDRFGVDFVAFLDENFVALDRFTHGKWLDDFSESWIKEGLQPRCIREGKPHNPRKCDGVHWGTTAHVALVSPGLLKRLRELGCSYLDYGLESFHDPILNAIGKRSTAQQNERAIRITLEAGIRPIPNQIIGFPEESFDSIRDSLRAWERLGIQSYPFFATPYPGSEWFYTHKNKILEQYGGDLEAFLLDLGDATKITAVISKNFNTVELLGLRELMVSRDLKRIDEYEHIWRRNHRQDGGHDCQKG